MSHDVFLSHSAADRGAALALLDALRPQPRYAKVLELLE
jgi:hypothetical protein